MASPPVHPSMSCILAAAVETGEHLARCMVYVDLNMVRAGVVQHPAEWEVGGYHEIQRERERYRIVDRVALAEALGVELPELAEVHRDWVETALREARGAREERWTEAMAVGSRGFVEQVQRKLGGRGRYRVIEQGCEDYLLRESREPYGLNSAAETAAPRRESA